VVKDTTFDAKGLEFETRPDYLFGERRMSPSEYLFGYVGTVVVPDRGDIP
jgi:hypothetical protein